MPLTKLESISPECMWGLWEINETEEELISQLGYKDEVVTAEDVRLVQKRVEKIAARLVLKKILDKWNLPFLGTGYSATRKPFLNEHFFSISLSHSHDKSVAIVQKNKNIDLGIDIEMVKDKILQIAPRVNCSEELKYAAGNPEILTILWSIKEVLYKINGERGIDFKKDLFVRPFIYNENGGETIGDIKTNSGTKSYTIKYLRHGNHVVAFNL